MNQIKDTRGRPRNSDHEWLANNIIMYHAASALPHYFDLPGKDKKRELKRFRNSQAFKDIQDAGGHIFRLLPKNGQVLVCYRSSYNA